MSEHPKPGWQAGLSAPAIEAIEKAARQFEANEHYEASSSRLVNTQNLVRAIEAHSSSLATALSELSPVGRGVIFEAALQMHVDMGRQSMEAFAEQAAIIALATKHALSLLLRSAPSLSEEGQGAGSAAGKISDLRAIAVGLNLHTRELDRLDRLGFHSLRSPKDKFGVAVIMAVIKHDNIDVCSRGAGSKLKEFLADVWALLCAAEPANWDRVVRLRRVIAAEAARLAEQRAIWKQAAERYASSPKSRSRRRKET